jgi:hypothetical protein
MLVLFSDNSLGLTNEELDENFRYLHDNFLGYEAIELEDEDSEFTPLLRYPLNIINLNQNSSIEAPLGAPFLFQSISFKIKDDGVSRDITWDSIYNGTLPDATTISNIIYIAFIYNGTSWDLLSLVEE